MNHDFILGGVILSPLVPELAVAFLATVAASVVLMRLDLFRFTWHRPLVELAIFCIVLGGIVAFTPDGSGLAAGWVR